MRSQTCDLKEEHFGKKNPRGWRWGENTASENSEWLGVGGGGRVGVGWKGGQWLDWVEGQEHPVLRELCPLPEREDTQINTWERRPSTNFKRKHRKRPLVVSLHSYVLLCSESTDLFEVPGGSVS